MDDSLALSESSPSTAARPKWIDGVIQWKETMLNHFDKPLKIMKAKMLLIHL